MKKKIIVLLATTLAVPIAFSASAATDDNATESDTALQALYKIGSEIDIPDGKVNVDGKEYAAQKVVITPDGRAYETDRIKADKLGVYTVEYRAFADGQYYAQKKQFETYADMFAVTEGRAEYGKETRYQTGFDGIKVSLNEGGVFTSNHIVDLRKLDRKTPFFRMFATPSAGAGKRDVRNVFIQLTDVYDSNNFVTIVGQSVDEMNDSNPWWINNFYISATAVGGVRTGIEWGTAVHVGNDFGYPINYSLYGYRNFGNSVGKEFYELSYDYGENRLYVPTAEEGRYIIDLDDPRYFGNSWKGFTTGEVTVSVWGTSYREDWFDFFITKIGDNDLSVQTFVDRVAPVITVEKKGETPTASCGLPYTVFPATASDGFSGVVPVSVRVFYNYNGDNRYELPIKDGRFVPREKGVYTLEYTAVDYAGNTETQTVTVNCDDVDRTLRLTLGDIPASGKTGETIMLAPAEATGGVGAVELKTTVMFGDKKITISDGGFVPNETGRYTVETTATDFGGQTASERYDIDVTANDRSVIEKACLPDYMVADCTYVIPVVTAYDPNTKQSVACSVKVNGEQLRDGIYNVPENAVETEIVYEAGSSSKTYLVPIITYISYASLFVSDGGVTDGANGVTLADGEFLFANALSNDIAIGVSVGAGSKLELSFTDYNDAEICAKVELNSGRHEVTYDAMRCKLFVDGEQACAVRLGSGVRFGGRVNGSAVVRSINGRNMYGEERDEVKISVDGYYDLNAAYGKAFTVLSAVAYKVLKPNGAVSVTVTDPRGAVVLEAPASESHAVVADILGEYTVTYRAGSAVISFKINAVDRTAPDIVVNGAPPASVTMGEMFTVPFATAHDDIDGNVNVSCYVVFPDGMINNISLLDSTAGPSGYSVRLTKLGKHKIRYFAVDSEGNYAVREFIVTVSD